MGYYIAAHTWSSFYWIGISIWAILIMSSGTVIPRYAVRRLHLEYVRPGS